MNRRMFVMGGVRIPLDVNKSSGEVNNDSGDVNNGFRWEVNRKRQWERNRLFTLARERKAHLYGSTAIEWRAETSL